MEIPGLKHHAVAAYGAGKNIAGRDEERKRNNSQTGIWTGSKR